MLKRDELIGPSCLSNAAADEPLFVLRANDELAPEIVRIWADTYYSAKVNARDGITDAQQAKYREALVLASQMEEWKQEHAT